MWDFLSAIATMLGLIAIAVAVNELRQRRKRVSATYLEVDSRGRAWRPTVASFRWCF